MTSGKNVSISSVRLCLNPVNFYLFGREQAWDVRLPLWPIKNSQPLSSHALWESWTWLFILYKSIINLINLGRETSHSQVNQLINFHFFKIFQNCIIQWGWSITGQKITRQLASDWLKMKIGGKWSEELVLPEYLFIKSKIF